ncbi:MAG: DNA-protecting protein DprA, partial [Nocardioidaceae bacterium]|nr:DNA-protecting protein DprA [Nocardioidaceae bacterium]
MSTSPVAAPTQEQERLARATISLVVEPGDVRCLGLTRELGGVDFLDVLQHRPELRPAFTAAAARLADLDVERELHRAVDNGIRFIIPGDAEWPHQLDALGGAGALHQRGEVPVGLWVKGPLSLDRLGGSVAIVGSRSSTTYGDQVAADMSATVATAGRPVISGAAYGIDYAAHRGAVAVDGRTVAVLACGVDRAYPAQHAAMLEHLGEHHAVVSEAPPGAAPHRIRFLARNRLIAGLAQGTVAIEAAIRSGALN